MEARTPLLRSLEKQLQCSMFLMNIILNLVVIDVVGKVLIVVVVVVVVVVSDVVLLKKKTKKKRRC